MKKKRRIKNNDNEKNKPLLKDKQEIKKEKRNKNIKNLKKKVRKNNDNEEYKPSLIEIEEAEKEYIPSLIEIQEVEKEKQVINNENENNEGKVEIIIRPLKIKVVGPIIYELGEAGHALAVIRKVNNPVIIETIKDEKTHHNIATITPLEDFIFPEKYSKILTVPIPEDISVNDIINNITIDKGKYEVGKNDCFDTVIEILKITDADKKTIKTIEKNRPNAIKTLIISGINIPFYPFKKTVDLLRGIEKKSKKKKMLIIINI